jgi:hypothetical protein
LSECFQLYLIKKLSDNILHYSHSEMGSYVILFIIKSLNPNSRPIKELLSCIISNINRLSINKFSSNIVIKIVEGFENIRHQAINELFFDSKVYFVTKNKFGILVLETVIKMLTAEEKAEISSLLLKNFNKDEHSLKEYESLQTILEMLHK